LNFKLFGNTILIGPSAGVLYAYIRCPALAYVQSETASGLMGPTS
jgi:hypothetical protein